MKAYRSGFGTLTLHFRANWNIICARDRVTITVGAATLNFLNHYEELMSGFFAFDLYKLIKLVHGDIVKSNNP